MPEIDFDGCRFRTVGNSDGNPGPRRAVFLPVERGFVPIYPAPAPDAARPGSPPVKIGGEPFMNSFWKRASVNVAAWTFVGFFFASRSGIGQPGCTAQNASLSNAACASNPTYGKDIAWQNPRVVRLGARVSF